MAYIADPRTLVATADSNGVRINSDWHDEIQSWLRDREIRNMAGMTRATASSLCG